LSISPVARSRDADSGRAWAWLLAVIFIFDMAGDFQLEKGTSFGEWLHDRRVMFGTGRSASKGQVSASSAANPRCPLATRPTLTSAHHFYL